VTIMRWLSLAVVIIVSTTVLQAQTAGDIHRATDSVIHRLDLQSELPRKPEPELPYWLAVIQYWYARLTAWMRTPWFTLLSCVLGVALVLYTFRDSIPIWRLRRYWGWGPDAADDEDARTRSPAAAMSTADDLARQGRHAEAMHVLLLQSLADIRRRLDEQFADSLTSREILRSTSLSELGRVSLREIIVRVEWTYFGQREAVAADYMACRASFDRLSQALDRGASA
jgi:hypothetical protein